MSNVTPADILKMQGQWVQSKEFVQKVSKKVGKSERQTYRLIKNDKAILKFRLQDGTVLYGLPEFGPPRIEAKSPEISDTVRLALEHGILTREELDRISFIDFLLENPEVLELSNHVKDTMKLIRKIDLQKLKTLKKLGESSK